MIINIQSSMAVILGSEEVYFTGVEVELVVSVNFSKSTILGGTSFFPHNFNSDLGPMYPLDPTFKNPQIKNKQFQVSIWGI